MNKRLILICSIFFFSFVGYASEDPKGPSLKFDKEQHDFGTVYTDNMPETKLAIEFTNSGDQPLILTNVRACCGTRVTQWPREPITPGEKGVINIEFTLAPRPQQVSRTVTVSSNSQTNPTAIYRIVGRIENKE